MSDNNELDIIKIIHDAGNRSLLDDTHSKPDQIDNQIDNLIDVLGKIADCEHKTKEELEAERVAKFIKDDKIKDETLAKPLTENMKIAMEFGHSSDGRFQEMIGHSMPAFIDNLAIKHLVGIQPMNMPCQLIYKLQYDTPDNALDSDINDRKISLQIVSTAVEAQTFKFDDQIESDADNTIESFMSENFINKFTKQIYEETKHDIITSAHTDSVDVTDNHTADRIKLIIHKFANEIARNTRRGCGNWAIVSDTVAKILKKHIPKDMGYIPRVYGYLDYIGHCGGIAIYNDHIIKHDKIIIGYKGGSGETDNGYFYCPYMPIIAGAITNPYDFSSTIAFHTRYGTHQALKQETVKSDDEQTITTKLQRSDYYYCVTLAGLPTRYDIAIANMNNDEVLKITDSATDIFEDVIDLENLFDTAMSIFD